MDIEKKGETAMLIQNQPNAAKLLTSLRNTGYDSYAAIEDIIDNSIDAGARNIKIIVNTVEKEHRIIIADDGSGMNKEILDEALKLGSKTEKDEQSDLGKYGMGLCTASISFSRRLEVLTKQADGSYLFSSQDLDEIVDKNDFLKELRDANKEEIALFEKIVGTDHGTIVKLGKIDRLSNTNLTIFAATLSKEIGRIYRKFIQSNIAFYINDKKVEGSDPLMLDHKGTKIYSDEVYGLPTKNGKDKVQIKVVILPDVNTELEKDLKMNIHSQGFYVLRNNREIAKGETLDVFKKHNDFNRLRMELSFAANLDDEMGVKFSKDGISPNQAITDFIKQEIGGQIESIRRMFLKEKVADKSKEISHEESAAVIAQKAKLLITPKPIIEKREPRSDVDVRERPQSTSTGEPRTPKKTHLSTNGLGARFETLSLGRLGALYDCYQEGKVIVIQWNVDHPFYERIILMNKDRKDVTAGIDYLVYALASAELKTANDDNTELLITIKSIMSTNLRALLS
jgi:hypothetical protein